MKTLAAAVLGLASLATIAATVPAAAYVPAPAPRSPAFCDSYATDVANAYAGNKGQQALIGGLIGGAAGYFIGGYGFGRPGAGLLIGGTVGALIGAHHNDPQWQAIYSNAYTNCIYGYPL
jgi:hypothetical protein